MATPWFHLLLTLLRLGSLVAAGLSGSSIKGMKRAADIQREQLNRMRDFLGPIHAGAHDEASETLSKRRPTITFSNPKAQEYYVDGTAIPDVKFDVGSSWAGLMPISGAANETRKLFFWFWPTNNASNVKDLLFWTNGGPGCSSLDGFLQEMAQSVTWSWGQSEPTPNPWSWTNLSNVLWVDQPVGTGFSQGKPNISNDNELAAQLGGFFEQFLEVFSELKGSNFFVSGESYAGYYVPYIANYFYEHPNPNLHLKGAWIADPSLSWNVVQQEIPALRFAQANKNVFPFNSTFWSKLQNISDCCGYTDYIDKVTYPPTGLLPLPAGATIDNVTGVVNTKPECEIHDLIQIAAGESNPAFDVYRVTDMYPSPWSVLGFPQSTQQFIYFNRTDVQTAIHAPHMNWELCSFPVYVDPKTGGPGEDHSLPSALSVLPNVIEKSERVAIVHGLADFILVAEGTRITIQNMTWNGTQGFQTPIGEENFFVDRMGVGGNMHTERGLTYVEFYYSGHMTPQFVPWAAYQTIAYVLGKRESPSA